MADNDSVQPFYIREKDYDRLVDNLNTIATFCTKQESINKKVFELCDDVEKIKKDYVSKSFIWKLITSSTLILSVLGTLGFKTAFLSGYTTTNESNAALQRELKNVIDKQAKIIEQLQRDLITKNANHP